MFFNIPAHKTEKCEAGGVVDLLFFFRPDTGSSQPRVPG
jgi:hypothetical protein